MNNKFMRQTLLLAEEALNEGELPIAALVVLDGKVIARGKTAEKKNGRLLVHAELNALQAADALSPFPGKRRNAVLYTSLEPCLMCLGAAMSLFIGKVIYAAESPTDGAVALVTTWQRQEAGFTTYQLPQIEGGLMRKDSIALFQHYVANRPPSALRDWANTIALLAK
ncbi:MAG: nucleoside deaminase [Chloroflexota bacterium]